MRSRSIRKIKRTAITNLSWVKTLKIKTKTNLTTNRWINQTRRRRTTVNLILKKRTAVVRIREETSRVRRIQNRTTAPETIIIRRVKSQTTKRDETNSTLQTIRKIILRTAWKRMRKHKWPNLIHVLKTKND